MVDRLDTKPDPTGAKVSASQLFERELAMLCAQMKGRSATVRMQLECRAKVEAMVRWLYENEGYIIDYQDGTAVASADEVHVVVRFEHGELRVNATRKRGRLQ